ncbi:MAG TPA: ADOP family duplicated permease [Candidatus Acidoferrum sp.]|nr:ADOP family duplicated permease [Candidatus Acidoferrum sp.]
MNFKPALFLQDLKVALRSLFRAKGLAITVILTLALGIGANAAIFTLVRGVLLRPLVNRDEDRLIYIRQSAPGIGSPNTYFSVPELKDIESGVRSISEFGDFSTIPFTMVGLGEPREVQAGVAGGTYFEVMGLHPVLGRLIGPQDDGPKADGVVVLTYRFWTSALHSDPNVLGKTVRLGSGPNGTRSGTIIGVLEPSIPYPADTEIIANVVTSPHHLSATMVDGRVHRMTELFGRLAPGATLEQARAELRTVYNSMTVQHPDGNYSKQADFQISATRLREQITSGARTVLLVLLAASGLVFIIAVSNVANLILARSVRREGELSIRAALGASTSTLRRTLLAESLLLCGAGALLGVLIARPMVAILARYASRFSIRALDLTVDSSMLWVGAGLAIIAAILLAFVPRLPSATSSQGFGLATGSVRITGGTNRRLRLFAMTQIAASFLLLAGASMLLKTLLDMQNARTVLDANRVLAVNVPVDSYGKKPEEINHFYEETIRRVSALPGVDAVAVGDAVPWRDTQFNFQLQFSGDGHVKGPGEEDPRTQVRTVSPGFFAALHVPILEGRDFNDLDRQDKEPVVVISQSVAQRMFPGRDPLNRHLWWTDPVIAFIGMESTPRRIVGVVADVDDTHVIPSPTLTVYDPMEQQGLFGGRLFVHTHSDPYALVTPIVQLIRTMSADQPVEKAATLEDIRAEVLTPDRLNSLVFGGFALVALAIAIVGVAGVLAFSVSARTREFGIRLAIGSQPSRLLAGVIREGAVMAAVGIVVGAIGGYILARLAGSYLLDMKMPSPLPVLASAFILLVAAVAASALPAARAARVDVIQALRAE